jgi:hypothetical protein
VRVITVVVVRRSIYDNKLFIFEIAEGAQLLLGTRSSQRKGTCPRTRVDLIS